MWLLIILGLCWHPDTCFYLSYLFALDFFFFFFPTFSWINHVFQKIISFYLYFLLEGLSLSLRILSLLLPNPRQHQNTADILSGKLLDAWCRLPLLWGLCALNISRLQQISPCHFRSVSASMPPQHSARVPRAPLGASTFHQPLWLSNLLWFLFPSLETISLGQAQSLVCVQNW